MKKGLLILFILSSFNSKGTIHTIGVWGGYYEFVPASITIQLGDTVEWEPYFGLLPMMLHTITSDNIPVGAVSFDQVWKMPADTFLQYIPQVAGLYQYVCTPHIPNGMIGEFTVITGTTAVKEHTTNKELLKVTDILGRETNGNKNEPLFYIYDDGTIEKKIIIE
jgi:plastocyanin